MATLELDLKTSSKWLHNEGREQLSVVRDDLLPAQASIDWAVSNFPAFQELLSAWLQPEQSHNSDGKRAAPLVFNAEAGAYINAIVTASIFSLLRSLSGPHIPRERLDRICSSPSGPSLNLGPTKGKNS
jgi:hypothetical protein